MKPSVLLIGAFVFLQALRSTAQVPMPCRLDYQVHGETNLVLLSWEATPTNSYNVLATDDLSRPWTALNPQPLLATSNFMELQEEATLSQRFYQVINRDIPSNMVWIPAGTFIMGSPSTEAERLETEGPLTEVNLTHGFWMGRYEVRQVDYLRLTGTNPSYFGFFYYPVDQVSWNDATNYCGLLTERERTAGRLPRGYVFRLPTEAEWEYACRAGTTTAFSYGPALRSGMANFGGKYEYDSTMGTTFNPSGVILGRPRSVGFYKPNGWGLYDMHGNVVEWCWDWWGPSLPGGQVSDPRGPDYGISRIERGGAWLNDAWGCRSAFRDNASAPHHGYYARGFRVVLGHPYPLE